ncbi:MAG: hypothetical protein QOH25_1831 [Acidobacteriota bacterium]|jgi:hypothetical protein|nr:hypothetical protein [Acidobacteriota bacterium]
MRKSVRLLPILVLLFLQTTNAQSPPTSFQTKPITQWIGERFIFLERAERLKEYGYQLIHRKKDKYKSLPYQPYVGKVVKVVSVAPSSSGLSGVWNIDLIVEGTNEQLTAEAFGNQIQGVAPLSDIEKAREIYKGKNLLLKEQTISKYTSETSREYVTLDSVPAPVQVVDVVPAWDANSPVRFILRTPSGQDGFVDVSMSGTNASEELRAYFLFDKFFLPSDPKGSVYKTPAPLPSGKYGITTKYDRFTNITEAVLQETLAKTGEGVYGLRLTAVAYFEGNELHSKAKFQIALSWTKSSKLASDLKFREAEQVILLIDGEPLSLSVRNYKYHVAEIMSWVSEYGTLELSDGDINKLLKAKTVEGRWGDVEFRFTDAALDAFNDFAGRLTPR